ncbi:Uncharacterised protein [uncultured Flavonifractor sp.]|nr:Uncharacterised protein [uncultured Flavonifractor sp.]
MIKIISGVYGYLDKNGCVKPKTEKDGPFQLTEEQEARLVGLGVAEYVHDPIGFDEQPPEGDADIEYAHLDPEQLWEMTNAQLKELAEEMGIDTKKLTTKAKLIEAITSVDVIPSHANDETGEGTEGDGEDDGEPLPDFDPAEAVL